MPRHHLDFNNQDIDIYISMVRNSRSQMFFNIGVEGVKIGVKLSQISQKNTFVRVSS